jgi:hypothetical protein
MDLEFGTPREVERQSQCNPMRPGCGELECNACLVALHNTFATVYDTSQNDPTQPPRYGLRERTAHHMASDGRSHEDASKHHSPPKRPKRTPTFTRAHSPSQRGSAKKRTIKGLGRRRTRKDEDKAWFAEAILEESGSQYLIEYEPVEEGAQCEISWQPKCNANEALITWWEERKIGSALEDGDAERDNVRDLLSEDNEASQHYNSVDLHSNDCDAMVGSKQSSGARTIVRDSQRMLYQRPDTGINTILSPEIPARLNGGNDGTASLIRRERNKAPPEDSAHVGVLRDGHANVSGAPLGRLKSARQILRLKLRESRRKRWRSTRILSPPADRRTHYTAAAGYPWTDSGASLMYAEHVQHVRYTLVALRGMNRRIKREKIENHKQYAKR